MKRRHKQHEKQHRMGEIPTGSFSDIAFLLIIFFLVVTSLTKTRTITAEMPTGETKQNAPIDETPVINVRGTDLYFNEKKVTLDSLKARLATLDLSKKSAQERVILLEATQGTAYQQYYEVLAAISENGGMVALVEEE